MVEHGNGIWLTLIKAITAGQRLNSKVLKLYIFGTLLTLLTIFLGLIEMLFLTKRPTNENGDLEAKKTFVKPSRFTRNPLLTTKKNLCSLRAS